MSSDVMEVCHSNANYEKYFNVKQFVSATRDYSQSKTEENANKIKRHLQIISVTIDSSIFDPHTSVITQFFVSLHELMTFLEPGSHLMWCCVNVLSTCCKNLAAREALIHTYQFVPQLSRLLGEHLTLEKKIKLLTLLEELSCGIKISWQIPHLSHLMKILTKWVTSDNDEVISLSLAVLVNLCYKNLPALYTLTRCIDVKGFMRALTTLEGIKFEVHVCKLLIIFEHMHGKVPQAYLIKLTEITFKSIGEALKAKDNILLRHIVDFFLDIKINNMQDDFILFYDQYDVEIDKLLMIMEDEMESDDGESKNSECIVIILRFLQALIVQKLPKLYQFYKRISGIAINCLQDNVVSSQALSMLKVIAINLNINDVHMLESIFIKLPIFLVDLELKSSESSRNIDYNKRISYLMDLLATLTRFDSFKCKIIDLLKLEHVEKIFSPLLDESLDRKTMDDYNSTETIELFVNTLTLINEIGKESQQWNAIYADLLKEKQIHVIAAQALFSKNESVRSQTLELLSRPNFPRAEVSKAMTAILPCADIEEKKPPQQFADNLCLPIMSVNLTEKVDEMLAGLRDCLNKKNFFNIATTEVMELYEYKLASMGHAERMATASVEAASQRCTYLEHRIAQLTPELSRTTKLLYHAQQTQEELATERDSLKETAKNLTNLLEASKGKNKVFMSQLAGKEKLLMENEDQLKNTMTALSEANEQISRLSEQQKNLQEELTQHKELAQKLKESLQKKEKVCERKEEMLRNATRDNEELTKKYAKLEQTMHATDAELARTKMKLEKITEELMTKSSILETITKLTRIE